MKAVIAALLIYASVNLFALMTETDKAAAERESLQSEVERLSGENETLKYEIEHSGDISVIEDVARGKLGLVKPGEKIFIDANG